VPGPKAKDAPAAKPKILSFDEIEAVDDRPVETIDVPEWGGAVQIRKLSKAQVTEATKAAKTADGMDAAKWIDHLVCLSLVAPVIVPEQLPTLREKSNTAVERIHSKVMELNGIGGAALEAVLQMFLD
jgi:hypothetical protein